MTVHVPDRFKAANAFWIGLAKIGLTPAAGVEPSSVATDCLRRQEEPRPTTAQFFALWHAVGESLR